MGRCESIENTGKMVLVRVLHMVLLECYLLPNHPPDADPYHQALSYHIKATATPQAQHTLCTSALSAHEE